MNKLYENGTKTWNVTYDHKDGRKGTIKIVTEVVDSGAFQYGNGKAGLLKDGQTRMVYDLRYEHGDLHMAMITNYFGDGLIKAVSE